MRKFWKIVLNILIVLSVCVFLLALCWLLNGSLEMFPTEEQQEKARIGAALLMTVSSISTVIFTATRFHVRKCANSDLPT